MGSPGGKSQGGNNTQIGLHPPLPVQTQFDQVTSCHKQLCQCPQKPPPFGGPVSAGEQKCSRTGTNSKINGVLQQAIFDTQTQQPVETYLGPEHLEHLPTHRVIQNGDTRDNKNSLQAGEWVTSIDFKNAYFHIPIHSQSRKYMHFHVHCWSYQFKALPFGLSTAPMGFTVVTKEVKLMALQRGIRIHQYLDNCLVSLSHIPSYAAGGTSPKLTCLPPGSTTNCHSLCHWFQTPRHGHLRVLLYGEIRRYKVGSGCTQPVLGRSGPICFPTSSYLGQSSGEVAGLPIQ